MRFRRNALAIAACAFAILVCALSGEDARAEDQVTELRADATGVRLDPGADAWIESLPSAPGAVFPGGALEVLHEPSSAETRHHHLSLGYIPRPAWVRARVKNTGEARIGWILRVSPALLEDVELHQFDEVGNEVMTSTYRLGRPRGPPPPGVVDQRGPAFRVNLPAKGESVFIARIRSIHHLDIQLTLDNPNEALRNSLNQEIALGTYYGIFLAVLLVNAFVFLATRERAYLYYIFFTSALWMVLATMSGFIDYYLKPPLAFSPFLAGFSGLVCMAAHQFTRSFLRTPVLLPRWDRVHLLLMGVCAIYPLVAFSPWGDRVSVPVGYGIDTTVILSILCVLVSAIRASLKGFKPAWFFLLSWSSLLMMVAVYFLATYGAIPSSDVTQYAVQIGSSLEMILLSLALAYRVRALKRERASLRRKARESDLLRSLMRVICHDLRNPLTVVLTHAQVNSLEPARAGADDWARIARAANQQKTILDYVRAREMNLAARKKPPLQRVSLRDAVEESRFVFEDRFRDKKLKFECALADGADELAVWADPVALTHTVINNLISNAIKFSLPEGIIRITATRENGAITLQVSDSGIGIPAELLKSIFSPLNHTTRVGTAGERGTGFGMPLVESMVRSFGGKISVKSRTAQDSAGGASGTTIRVRLREA
jgi:signal transduction histidine kinase